MGDPRRFSEFADLIARNTSGRDYRVVDVAGGYGSLRACLYSRGFQRIATFDPREYEGRNKPRCAKVRQVGRSTRCLRRTSSRRGTAGDRV